MSSAGHYMAPDGSTPYGSRLEMENLSKKEPTPITNEEAAIFDLVKKDLDDRDRFGKEKYGTRLQAHNGRNPLVDSFQEKIDDLVYTRQAIEELRILGEDLRGILEIANSCGSEDIAHMIGLILEKNSALFNINLSK